MGGVAIKCSMVSSVSLGKVLGSNLQNTVDNEVFLELGKGTEGRRQRLDVRGLYCLLISRIMIGMWSGGGVKLTFIKFIWHVRLHLSHPPILPISRYAQDG